METNTLKNQSEQEKIKINRNKIILAVIAGILLAISFSSLKLAWFAWFALVPFFIAIFKEKISVRGGFSLALIFSLSFYLGMLHWMFRLHPLTWLGFSETESLLIVGAGWFVFSLIESIWLSLFGLVIALLRPRGWHRLLFPTFLWILIEWFQSLGNFGFTWGRLANSQFQYLYLIQSASLFGSLFISGLIVFVNLALALTIIDYQNRKPKYAFLVAAAGLFLLNLVFGIVSFNFYDDNGRTIKTTVIQGNIRSDQKWAPGALQNIMNTYLDLSYQGAMTPKEEDKPELVVWPETAIPTFIDIPAIISELQTFTSITGTHLVTGIFNRKADNFYNSIAVINPHEKILGVYAKQHLVPFGEYLPFRNLLKILMPKLGSINALEHDVSPGLDSGIVSTKYGQIGGIICFESIFPAVVRRSVNDGAELLVMVTNDSWYKDSMGVYQHNSQAVLRAVENGRYLVRAANTGISSIISYRGEIKKELAPLKKGMISSEVKFRKQHTLYSFVGDFIAIISLFYILLLLIPHKKPHITDSEG